MVRHLVLPALVLGIYLAALRVVLPFGVNQTFAQALLLLTSAVAATALLVHLALGRVRNDTGRAVEYQREPFRAGDVVLLLLPLSPVAQYVLLNPDVLHGYDIAAILGAFTLACAGPTLVVPHLLSRWVPRDVMAMLGLSVAFVVVQMAALTRSFTWHRSGDFPVQLGVLVAVFAVCLLIYRKERKTLYAAAACWFAVTVVVSQAGGPSSTSLPPVAAEPERSAIRSLADARPIVRTPDVFLLTYDGYVENETMLQYGIDNSPQETFLESRGFRLYPGVHSVAADSVATMGRVLGGADPGRAVAGYSPVLDVLKRAGYRSHGVFRGSYFFRGTGVGYDHGFPSADPAFLVLIKAILEGEFRHDVYFRGVRLEDFLEEKRAILGALSEGPTFLYTHTGPSHSQNSGACLEDEVARYQQRLVEANLEMREDVETILRANPGAIVIVNGDHGPYLTKNCWQLDREQYDPHEVTPLDIQDRFGSFLAIRWPGDASAAGDGIEILQDVLPSVLAYLFDDPAFSELRLAREVLAEERHLIAGLSVADGRIVGGAHDGRPLYEARRTDR